MAQLHPHLWNTHPDVSPFVPLNAAFLQAGHLAGLAAQNRGADSSQRQPESMQVDSTAVPGGANASSGSAADAAAAAYRAAHSGAGPSGVAPGGADDATMAEPPRKVARKHSDAPMRKLSVSLIDTYKLINQVSSPFEAGAGAAAARVVRGRGRIRGGRRRGSSDQRATLAARRCRPSSCHAAAARRGKAAACNGRWRPSEY